jgi:hypothetical protein
VIVFTRDLNFTPETIPVRPCINLKKATSFYEYVNLVMCAERALPNFTPRMILSLLRQTYYGHESWSKRKDKNWKDIIPCGPNIMPSPDKALGTLLPVLKESQTVENVDIGHIFTGLEAMCCPRTSLAFSYHGHSIHIDMPNVEMATWGGDLGSAVALKVFNESDKGMPIQNWDQYMFRDNTRASTADFNGDIDAYAIGTYLSASQCAAVSKIGITQIKAPISQILYEYYVDDRTALARFRAQRIGCFAQGIGGKLSSDGRSIVGNLPLLYSDIAKRVASFARIYYIVLRRQLYSFPRWLNTAGMGTWILSYSRQAIGEFIYWLQGQL